MVKFINKEHRAIWFLLVNKFIIELKKQTSNLEHCIYNHVLPENKVHTEIALYNPTGYNIHMFLIVVHIYIY